MGKAIEFSAEAQSLAGNSERPWREWDSPWECISTLPDNLVDSFMTELSTVYGRGRPTTGNVGEELREELAVTVQHVESVIGKADTGVAERIRAVVDKYVVLSLLRLESTVPADGGMVDPAQVSLRVRLGQMLSRITSQSDIDSP